MTICPLCKQKLPPKQPLDPRLQQIYKTCENQYLKEQFGPKELPKDKDHGK